MKLFTSIPGKSKNLKIYENVSRTWKKIANASLYSLNYTEELATHPLVKSNIEFIDCGNQEIFDYSRKPLVSIQKTLDIIMLYAKKGELVGIINAYIMPNGLYDWCRFDNYIKENELHVFKRLEQLPKFKQCFDPFEPYKFGYDLFMFRVPGQHLNLEDTNKFCY